MESFIDINISDAFSTFRIQWIWCYDITERNKTQSAPVPDNDISMSYVHICADYFLVHLFIAVHTLPNAYEHLSEIAIHKVAVSSQNQLARQIVFSLISILTCTFIHWVKKLWRGLGISIKSCSLHIIQSPLYGIRNNATYIHIQNSFHIFQYCNMIYLLFVERVHSW